MHLVSRALLWGKERKLNCRPVPCSGEFRPARHWREACSVVGSPAASCLSSTSAPAVHPSSFCLSISPFHKCSGSGSVLPCFCLSPLSQTHTYSPVFPKRLALLNTVTMTNVTRAHSKPCTAHPLPAPPAVSFCFQEPREAGDTRRHSRAGLKKRVPLVFPPSVMDHFCTCFSKAPCVKNSGSVSSHCCKSDLECRADQVKLQLTSPH